MTNGGFCGDSPLWDLNLTWYSEYPDFTRCFEDSVLAYTPCLFLWVLCIFEFHKAYTSDAGEVPTSPLNVAKTLLTAILCVLQVLVFVYPHAYGEANSVIYLVEQLTPVIRFLTFALVLFLIWFGKRKGIRSSGIQFTFWFLMLVCEAFAFRTSLNAAIDGGHGEETFLLVIRLIYYPCVVCEFLLNCFTDVSPISGSTAKRSLKECPEESASFISKLLFLWFDDLAWKGYKKPLSNDDLWDLNDRDKSSTLVPIFEKYWKETVDKNKSSEASDNGASRSNADASFHKVPDEAAVDFIPKGGQKPRAKEASVLAPLVRIFLPPMLFGAFLKLIQDVLTFVAPQILKALIAFVSDSANTTEETYAYAWKGYFFAVLLLASSFAQTILLSQYFHLMLTTGMRIRTTLVAAIYKKSLIISSMARRDTTAGEIVNLMSVDAQRFMELTTYVNMLWSAPLQIVLAMYFLWGTLGPSVLAGLAVMILLVPMNALIASKTKNLQVKQMKFKDQRVKLVNEILAGMKVLKLYAWETSFEKQVADIRSKEMGVLKDAAYWNAGAAFLWTCAPFLVAAASFATYVLIDPANILDAEKAFVALSLFNILRFPMSMLPNVITTLVQAKVSLTRVNRFMNFEEIDQKAVSHDTNEKDPVIVENGKFSWDSETTVLDKINLRVQKGSLVAVCGVVGSGKSSLLSAILGEMQKENGRVNTVGNIAYVPQQAWIQNATLKDNILFGKKEILTTYNKVVEGCALLPDLEVLTAGDQTEIGEKGINLSGGQKQRVSLARAVYNDADVYLLDDPLSAVDSHVGKHIYDKVLGHRGMLRQKTRILVTHGLSYLPDMDQIIVMKDGQISEIGSYDELLTNGGAFAEFIMQHVGASVEEGLDVDAGEREVFDHLTVSLASKMEDINKFPMAKAAILRQLSQESAKIETARRRSSRSQSLEASGDKRSEAGIPVRLPKEKEKLIEEEKSETGSVKFSVYIHYLKSAGIVLTIITLLFHVAFQGFAIGGNLWLSAWANSNEGRLPNDTQPASERDMYLGVYVGLGLAQALTSLIGSVALFQATIISAITTHNDMLANILRSPMWFFDTTPLGRILNRFSKDQQVIDETLAQIFRAFIFCFLGVVATVVVISYTTPIFIAVIVPIGIIYVFVQRFYVATSRQLKRLESVSRSPIYSHFGETIAGASTVRAYRMQNRFIQESEAKVDFNQIAYYPSIVSNRWLAVRLETVGNFIVFFAAIFAVTGRDGLDPGLVGLSISYALQVTQVLNWLVRMTSDVEANIVAVERIKEYTETQQEAPWNIETTRPPKSWPESGCIEVQDYSVRYRENLDLVLKNVDFKIDAGEKIGIVGRTGAGKSSFTLAIFRLIEPAGGLIRIDGRDISKLGLHELRSRLTIIPQDPVLFSGTLRINLDPFGEYSDSKIYQALELAHLKSFVKSLPSQLEHLISEGGENLSVGQRQLVCLARALLRKTNILILDEATAAVDLETDDLIQQTIRTQFDTATVLTIAHRLNTIMDSTRVLVLEEGRVKEFDSPKNLLRNRDSLFYGMAKSAGLVRKEENGTNGSKE